VPPATPSEAPSVKPQEGKPVSPQKPLDYQTAAPERTSEIVDNLNKYYTTNPELFDDRNLFNTNFEYAKRSEAQKKTLDAWYNRNVIDRKNIGSLANKSTNDIVK
jgi:hypothetical protein